MTATVKPRQLNRDDFVRRLRELLDEGLDHDTIIDRMDPVRSMSVTEDFMRDALDAIASALTIADEVSNARMVQSHKDFVSYERRAQDESHTYVNRCRHIETAYPDEPIRRAKRSELDAAKDKWRELADQAAADWQTIQRRRIPYDQAVQDYPQAFSDDERKVWEAKPVN